jgi:hypothetical protein
LIPDGIIAGMNERINSFDMLRQYSPLGERGVKILEVWRSYKKYIGGLEGDILMKLVREGKPIEESIKELDNLRPIRKALIEEFEKERLK